jgi:hypothetical protein
MNTTSAIYLPPRKRGARSDKSPARVAIEAALQAVHPESLSNLQLAARCNVPLAKVRTVISNLCGDGYAHRVPPSDGTTCTTYGWGGRPPAEVDRQQAAPAPIVTRPPTARTDSIARGAYIPPTGHYDGGDLKPYAGRANALHAFTLPSLQNGEVVERRAPIIMGSTPPARGRS